MNISLKNGYEYSYFSEGVELLRLGGDACHTDSIHFLPTGSSDAILLESDGHFALVDCAEDSDNPRGFEELSYRGYENEVLEYLKNNACGKDGRVRLDFIIGTHAHSDHLGGFDTVLADESVTVERAYIKRYEEEKICAFEREKWDNREVYEQTVAALEKRNIPIVEDITEKRFRLGNFDITLFNTEYDDNCDLGENDNSLGVLVEAYGIRAFLAGDINNVSGDEKRLAPLINKVNILKVGHHSYSASTSEEWLKALMPDVCIVTNNYESTDKTTLKRIKKICSCPILVTGNERGIVSVFNKDGKLSFYKELNF